MEMSSITEPISVFDFRTGSGQKAQEPVIVEMRAQAHWMDPPGIGKILYHAVVQH